MALCAAGSPVDGGVNDLAQSREVEWLLKEARGWGSVDPIDGAAEGVAAHEEDWEGGIEFPDTAVGGFATHSGHGEIEQHAGVGCRVAGELFEGRFTAGSRLDRVAPESQGADEHAADGIFIVDDEHSWACRPGLAGSHNSSQVCSRWGCGAICFMLNDSCGFAGAADGPESGAIRVSGGPGGRLHC